MENNKSLKLKIIYFLIIIFVLKNIISFTVNYFEIKKVEAKLADYKEENLQIIDDIKNIKTDGFVIRYAVDNLNLRPKEEDLVNLNITDEELIELEIRLAANKFGKKFENIPLEKIEISDELKNNILERMEEKKQSEEDDDELKSDESIEDSSLNNELLENNNFSTTEESDIN